MSLPQIFNFSTNGPVHMPIYSYYIIILMKHSSVIIFTTPSGHWTLCTFIIMLHVIKHIFMKLCHKIQYHKIYIISYTCKITE